jgi:hypothetical protein
MATPTKKTTTPTTEQRRSGPSTSNGLSTFSGPTHEQISKRAYEIFLARGGQHGRQDEDWAQAERELRLGRQ